MLAVRLVDVRMWRQCSPLLRYSDDARIRVGTTQRDERRDASYHCRTPNACGRLRECCQWQCRGDVVAVAAVRCCAVRVCYVFPLAVGRGHTRQCGSCCAVLACCTSHSVQPNQPYAFEQSSLVQACRLCSAHRGSASSHASATLFSFAVQLASPLPVSKPNIHRHLVQHATAPPYTAINSTNSLLHSQQLHRAAHCMPLDTAAPRAQGALTSTRLHNVTAGPSLGCRQPGACTRSARTVLGRVWLAAALLGFGPYLRRSDKWDDDRALQKAG